QPKTEVFVQRERVRVVFLRVDHGALRATARHPAQPVEGERAPHTISLMVWIHREALEETASAGTSRHRVSEHTVSVVGDAEATRWCRGHRLAQPVVVE